MNMHCSLVQLITIETIIFSAVLSDCSAAEFKHPPTFQDYQRAKAIDSKEAPEMDAQVAFFEAAAFTPQELGQTLERGVKEELIGAGIRVKPLEYIFDVAGASGTVFRSIVESIRSLGRQYSDRPT